MNEEKKEKQETTSLIAKKDHVLHHNNFHLEIKAGMDLSKAMIPKFLLVALKTEKVID